MNDDLSPARGMLIGFGIGLTIWGGIACLVMWFLG